MAPTHTALPYPLDLGPLGHIEGLTLTPTTTTSSSRPEPHCHYFGGIPYANPPVGPFRFRRARPLAPCYRYGTRANPGRFTGATALCPQPGFNKAPDTSLWDEDCLQLNIWVPAESSTCKKPRGGWPVFFYIHGGWLQYGTANVPPGVGANLIGEAGFGAMIVSASYRLNALGFLAGKELEEESLGRGEKGTVGNLGFWDQRMALEWAWRNVVLFGGDPKAITVGGYSAGSHSTFQQLAHDLDQPPNKQIIKRAVMWSNGPGVQPKHLPEHQDQFDELLTALDIPLSLSATEKLARLRAVPAAQLIAPQNKMRHSEFRALSDGAFISKTLIRDINNGTFARKLKERGIRILNGECSNEHAMYGQWRRPTDTYDAVYTRLVADYPEKAVKKLMPIYFPNRQMMEGAESWPEAFGKVYADMQVHCLERGFADRLAAGGLVVGRDLLRYHIDWRAQCADVTLPPEWGVTHSSDIAIWFWGNGWGKGLSEGEKKIVAPLNKVFADFVAGEDVQWPVKGPKKMLRLKRDGDIDMWEDENWERGLKVWNAVNDDDGKSEKAKL